MNVSKAKKVKKGQKGPNTLFSTFSLPGKGKKFSLPGIGKKFSLPGKGKIFFFPVFLVLSPFLGREKIFSSRPFGLFWPFLLKRVKTPISGQKRGGKFFPGGVRKHELGVGNYRQNGRKIFFFKKKKGVYLVEQ